MNEKPDRRVAAMAADMTGLLPQLWASEIGRAVDRVKNAGKRTSLDRWFRKQWYRAQRRVKKARGPGIEYN